MSKKKKTILIVVISIVILIVIGVSLFFFMLSPKSKSNEEIVFTVKNGSGYKSLVSDLYESDLIRNKTVAYIYLKIQPTFELKPGSYKINRNMSTNEILNVIITGSKIADVSITFVEGKRLTEYASIIAETFNYTEADVLGYLNDKEFLEEAIDYYWFLTDEILNEDIYYPLEGYLFPDTYEFKWDASVRDIAIKLIDGMDAVLTPYKSLIENSKYSVHEILSMAAIVEKEGNNEEDRKNIATVIFNRLATNMSLGMDVTAFYAFQRTGEADMLPEEWTTYNAYNTRGPNMAGKLPVGPICSASKMAIDAVFNPLDNDYLYFYADITTGKVYFAETYAKQQQNIQDILNGKK